MDGAFIAVGCFDFTTLLFFGPVFHHDAVVNRTRPGVAALEAVWLLAHVVYKCTAVEAVEGDLKPKFKDSVYKTSITKLQRLIPITTDVLVDKFTRLQQRGLVSVTPIPDAARPDLELTVLPVPDMIERLSFQAVRPRHKGEAKITPLQAASAATSASADLSWIHHRATVIDKYWRGCLAHLGYTPVISSMARERLRTFIAENREISAAEFLRIAVFAWESIPVKRASGHDPLFYTRKSRDLASYCNHFAEIVMETVGMIWPSIRRGSPRCSKRFTKRPQVTNRDLGSCIQLMLYTGSAGRMLASDQIVYTTLRKRRFSNGIQNSRCLQRWPVSLNAPVF